MSVYALNDLVPQLPQAGRWWVAPDAHVIGCVTLGEDVGVWFGAVIRADNDPMTIGARTNIQEGVMLHSDAGSPLTVGEDVTVGHHAILHGCTVGDCSLIGMGATVQNRVRIGRHCIVAPMPIRLQSPTVQPCRMAWWPTVTSSPTVSGLPVSECSMAPSWI